MKLLIALFFLMTTALSNCWALLGENELNKTQTTKVAEIEESI